MTGVGGLLRGLLEGLREFVAGADAPARPRTWLGRRVLPVGAAAAASLVVGLGAAELADREVLPPPLHLVVAALVAVPVVLLPRRPLLGWRIAFVVAAITVLLGAGDDNPWPWPITQVWVFPFALYAVAARQRREVLVWVWVSAAVLVYAFVPSRNGGGVLAAVTAIMLLGDQVRRRREAQARLADASERTELEQARRAVLEERTRIARELHDVVAHHMSLIAVRAETAPYRYPDVPTELAGEFAGIAENSREALADMRRLLGVLRSEEAPATMPQPGLADLADLVDAARQAGVDLRLSTHGAVASVPASVGLTAYRIVQEALSNARRHAAGTPVRIAVQVEPTVLTVDVANGPGSGVGSDDDADHAPHGLAGMRERTAALGGSLQAEPTVDGGFAVRALLPMQERP